jgi:hypothetical protein
MRQVVSWQNHEPQYESPLPVPSHFTPSLAFSLILLVFFSKVKKEGGRGEGEGESKESRRAEQTSLPQQMMLLEY